MLHAHFRSYTQLKTYLSFRFSASRHDANAHPSVSLRFHIFLKKVAYSLLDTRTPPPPPRLPFLRLKNPMGIGTSSFASEETTREIQ